MKDHESLNKSRPQISHIASTAEKSKDSLTSTRQIYKQLCGYMRTCDVKKDRVQEMLEGRDL